MQCKSSAVETASLFTCWVMVKTEGRAKAAMDDMFGALGEKKIHKQLFFQANCDANGCPKKRHSLQETKI